MMDDNNLSTPIIDLFKCKNRIRSTQRRKRRTQIQSLANMLCPSLNERKAIDIATMASRSGNFLRQLIVVAAVVSVVGLHDHDTVLMSRGIMKTSIAFAFEGRYCSTVKIYRSKKKRVPATLQLFSRNWDVENNLFHEVDTRSDISYVPSHERRAVLNNVFFTIPVLSSLLATTIATTAASARTPGSTDANEAIQQIKEGRMALQSLLENFDTYAQIDPEGRAKSTDDARRILGGIAPQGGSVAIEVAKATPLYRIDGAFAAIRKAILDADDSSSSSAWALNMDLFAFEEVADKLVYEIQKADGDFYGVLFASKGTTMIRDIFIEAKSLIKQGIADFDTMLLMLKEAGAPGV